MFQRLSLEFRYEASQQFSFSLTATMLHERKVVEDSEFTVVGGVVRTSYP